MVDEREREAPDPPRRAVPLALVGLGIAALVGVAGVVGATQFGDSQRVVPRGTGGGGDGTRHFVPEKGGPLAAPFPTEPGDTACYSTASIQRSAVLYREPGGAKRLRITPKTEWGSTRVLGVVSQRGEWLGVQASELKNGEIAWIRRSATTLDCVSWSLHADLSKRELVVRHNGDTVRTLHVAIGRRDNPTPKGRFSVTDRLKVTSARLALRLLRAGADRAPDRPAALLARRRPPGRARDQRRVEHRRAGQPRLHAHRRDPGALADQPHPARLAGLHPRLSAASHGRRPATVLPDVKLPPFQALLDEHSTDLYRFCVATAGRGEADDCFQEAWIAALRAYPKLRRADNLRAWLFRIAQNKAIDLHRSRARRPVPVETVPEPAAAGPAAAGVDGEPELWAALRALPPKQRTAVFCRDRARHAVSRARRAAWRAPRTRRGTTYPRA